MATIPTAEPAEHLTLSATSRAVQTAASPLQLSSITSSPYLPLPHPSLNLIFTPARFSDIPLRVDLLSSPSVDPFIFSPPRPYTAEHALTRFLAVRKEEQEIFVEWETTGAVRGLPLSTIREVKSDGSEEFVGEAGCIREAGYYEIEDEAERAKTVQMNLALPPGDPKIRWTWFCPSQDRFSPNAVGSSLTLLPSAVLLRSEYAGQQVMTHVLTTLLSTFLVPILKVEEIISFAFVGNYGSRAVHRKLGFEMLPTDFVKMRDDRGGHLQEEWVMRWTREQWEADEAKRLALASPARSK